MSVQSYYDAVRIVNNGKEIRHDIYKFQISKSLDDDIKQIIEDAPTQEIYTTDSSGKHLQKVY